MRAFAFVVAVVCCAAWLLLFAFRGWVPHDEGLLGQTAERTSRGELPHADFDDPYTGGLAQWNALAFRLLGARLSSLRVVLLVVAALFFGALWLILRRALSVPLAALLLATCVAWSVPNYFAALPSWYNLFCAGFGLLALLKLQETRATRWAAIAGLCGGISMLFKISGAFFVAAAFVTILATLPRRGPDAGSGRAGSLAGVAGAVLAALFPILVVGRSLSAETLIHFVMPPTIMAIVGAREAWQRRIALRDLLRNVAAFAAGVAVPLAVFVIPYVRRGALPALLHGVFVAPQRRLTAVAFPLPPIWMIVFALPLLLMFIPVREPKRRTIPLALAALLALAIPFALAPSPYVGIWLAARGSAIVITIGAAYVLLTTQFEDVARNRLIAAAATAAFAAMIQFPYSFATYFLYVAPLMVIAALFLLRRDDKIRPLGLAFAFFFCLFGAVWLSTGSMRSFGAAYVPRDDRALLLPDRANLLVPPRQRDGYEAIVALIREHARTSDFIWAGPDAPEIAFLSGKRQPTRGFYEALEGDSGATLVRLIDSHRIPLIAVNRAPEFSRRLDPVTDRALRERFPFRRQIGPFEVMWKNAAQ